MATRKCGNNYFPKYFMAVRKFTNIYHIPKYFCSSTVLILMVGSRIHYSILHKKKLTTDSTWHSYVDINSSDCYIGYEPA